MDEPHDNEQQLLCRNCETNKTRSAHLALTVRKAGVWIHEQMKHEGSWLRCAQEPCIWMAERLHYAGIRMED